MRAHERKTLMTDDVNNAESWAEHMRSELETTDLEQTLRTMTAEPCVNPPNLSRTGEPLWRPLCRGFSADGDGRQSKRART